MKKQTVIQVKLSDYIKLANGKSDYVIVDKSIKINRDKVIKIVVRLFWKQFNVVLIRQVKRIEYNLLIKGFRSNSKMIIFK